MPTRAAVIAAEPSSTGNLEALVEGLVLHAVGEKLVREVVEAGRLQRYGHGAGRLVLPVPPMDAGERSGERAGRLQRRVALLVGLRVAARSAIRLGMKLEVGIKLGEELATYVINTWTKQSSLGRKQ